MTTQSIIFIRTRTYANAIYLYGTNRLTARTENGVTYTGVASGYYTPVEQYAATNFSKYQIDMALSSGYLTQQEYDETMAYVI